MYLRLLFAMWRLFIALTALSSRCISLWPLMVPVLLKTRGLKRGHVDFAGRKHDGKIRSRPD